MDQIKRYCQPPGVILPPPVNVTSPPSFISDDLFKNEAWYNSTTFAIKASLGDVSLIDYQHRAASNASTSYAKSLFDTKFRLGSVTKVFTVLAVLLSSDKIGFEDSIAKYISGLDATVYKDVTISALASHTSNLGRFGYVGDLSFQPTFSPALLGLAPTNETIPGCDPVPGGKACTASQVLDMFNDPRYIPNSPNTAPMYSNIAFNLLGLALESAHPNQTYDEIMKKLIFDPVGMKSAGFDTPKASDGVLPAKGDNWFSAPFLNYDAGGGIWASPNDLHLFAHALREHKLICPVEMRKWLQPRSFLPSLHQLVGAPWEIIRPTDLDIKVGRPIDIYTKLGGVTGYTSYLILIPEYDLTITMNVASSLATPAIQAMLPAVIKPVVAYADKEARAQALKKYAGTYHGASGTNSSLTLTVDDGPGLKISAFTMNGASVLAGLGRLQGLQPAAVSYRLYPTDEDAWGKGKEMWRFQLDGPMRTGNDWSELNCASWNFGDPYRYLGSALESFGMEMGKDGKIEGINLKGWRSSLKRAG